MPISRRRRRRTRVAPGSSRSGSADLSINRSRRKKTNYWYVGASAIIAILVIGGFAIGDAGIGSGGGGPSRTGSSEQYVEGVGVSQDEMPTRTHIPESETAIHATVPATSGDHWAGWSSCGFFEHTLADELIVHNLEHGNIVISYNLSAQEDIEQLKATLEEIGLFSVWGVARAYDEIPDGTVVAAAWAVLDTMEGVDEQRLRTFFETYAGTLGPERIVCSQSGVMDPPPVDSGS